ncbi:MAG: TonB-dependent receptor [Bacteroidetes bacterium]|nr:TonB-dependent receptor [Bacteroidota bacterium]
MDREILSIKRKALRINLDQSIYGTFAEIGAGQEVVRNFFQVGGASGTVAKAMSAYDMTFSDAIYGSEGSGRYVSDSRLKKMLDHEFDLLRERLHDGKYDKKKFFAFSNTCTTLNFKKDNDPHGWMGVRYQLKPHTEPNEVIIHVRLKGTDSLSQQRVIGGIGTNLLFACYWYYDQMDDFIESLLDNLSTDQAEIDMIRLKGPDFDGVDNRLLALELVKKNFTDATIFSANKEVYQPKDILYKKNILCLRGRFRPVTKVNEDMMKCGLEHFKKEVPNDDDLVVLSEITLNNLAGDGNFENKDFLDRADILCNLGHTVMISNCHKHDKLINYLDLCKPQRIGIILGILNIVELFNENNYENAEGELLHYFGEIFKRNTRMLVYPYQPDKNRPVITTENLKVSESLIHLYTHLKANKFLVDLEGYDQTVLQIFSPKVIQMIKAGEPGWEDMVPDTVADIIKEKCLFEYPCEIS